MAIKVGINGFGRIGRNVYRAAMNNKNIDIVAVNDLAPAATLAHLLKYDSVLGNLSADIKSTENTIVVNGKTIKVFAEKDPALLKWSEVGAEYVIESTGKFTDKEKAKAHFTGGAKKIIITAPAKNEDITIVLGVNEDKYDPKNHHVVSNASCTTNCLAPMAKVMGLVMPDLKGKLDGLSIRVPTPNVSIVDLAAELNKPATKEEIVAAMKEAAQGKLKGILAVEEAPLVSSDFKGNSHSSIMDAACTYVVDGTLVKVMAWYDNEWGYSCRVVDLVQFMASKS
jgi:glyceraldehyde 3-phosphate dehydrogenase